MHRSNTWQILCPAHDAYLLAESKRPHTPAQLNVLFPLLRSHVFALRSIHCFRSPLRSSTIFPIISIPLSSHAIRTSSSSIIPTPPSLPIAKSSTSNSLNLLYTLLLTNDVGIRVGIQRSHYADSRISISIRRRTWRRNTSAESPRSGSVSL